LAQARGDSGDVDADADHGKAGDQGADLIEIEAADADPELAVDRLCDDEVEGAEPDLLGDFGDGEEEGGGHGVHHEHRRAEDQGVATSPAGDAVGVAEDDEKDQDKEPDPDQILHDLGEEIGPEFKLAGERTREEGLVNPPIPRHVGSLPFASSLG